MKLHQIGFSLILIILFAACSTSPQSTTSAGDIQTAIAQTQSSPKTLTTSEITPSPSGTLLPSATPTRTPLELTDSLSGRVSAFTVNLRNGPSTLHKVIGTYEGGTEILVTARIAENDWVEVEIGDHIGWMYSELLDIYGDINSLRIITFPDSLAVQGRVEDTEGNPIQDITISAFYQSEQGEKRVNVISDQNGDFIIYLPQDLLGTLDVQITGIGCLSPVVDLECQLDDFIQLDYRTFVTVPQQADIIFTYKPVTLTLKGKVFNSDGSLVTGIDVAGIRDDGAKTFSITNEAGEFSMPIDEGIWDVFSYTFDPPSEGARTTITVLNTNPSAIELFSPYGGVAVETPIGSVPSNVVLGEFIGQGVLREINNYNNAGRPVMRIREPRFIFQGGDQIWLYAEPVLTDGGNYYYEVYDPDFTYPVTLYARVIDITIIPK
ncbi:MAG: SH3 domain-containing protein [Anaerolineales bacterium]|jgi:hypothetical protein